MNQQVGNQITLGEGKVLVGAELVGGIPAIVFTQMEESMEIGQPIVGPLKSKDKRENTRVVIGNYASAKVMLNALNAVMFGLQVREHDERAAAMSARASELVSSIREAAVPAAFVPM